MRNDSLRQLCDLRDAIDDASVPSPEDLAALLSDLIGILVTDEESRRRGRPDVKSEDEHG